MEFFVFLSTIFYILTIVQYYPNDEIECFFLCVLFYVTVNNKNNDNDDGVSNILNNHHHRHNSYNIIISLFFFISKQKIWSINKMEETGDKTKKIFLWTKDVWPPIEMRNKQTNKLLLH